MSLAMLMINFLSSDELLFTQTDEYIDHVFLTSYYSGAAERTNFGICSESESIQNPSFWTFSDRRTAVGFGMDANHRRNSIFDLAKW